MTIETTELISFDGRPIELTTVSLDLNRIERELSSKYNNYRGDRCESFRPECRGGANFGMTINTTWKQHRDMEAVDAVAGFLDFIAEWPAAGTTAWELRRFIRLATVDQIIAYSRLLLEVVSADKGQLRNGPLIDMDDVYFRGSEACKDEIERFKKVHGINPPTM